MQSGDLQRSLKLVLFKINGWWYLVDGFGNGPEDISLDLLVVEVWV